MISPWPSLNWRKNANGQGGVKLDTPILVILGNPPYNGFAGMAVDEEQELLKAYRSSKRVQLPDK